VFLEQISKGLHLIKFKFFVEEVKGEEVSAFGEDLDKIFLNG